MTPLTPRTRLVVLAAAAVVVAAAVAACGSSAAAPGPPRAGPADPARPTAAEVDATKRALDDRASTAPTTVVTWGVDPAAGVVVVGVSGARTADVDRFVAGLDPRTLRVDTGSAPVRPLPVTDPPTPRT